jgi:glyoxylase I family protein
VIPAAHEKADALLSPLIVRAHHTAVSVRDFDAALAYFTNIVGMRLEGEMDQRREQNLGPVTGVNDPTIRWAMLELGGFRLELFKYYQPEGKHHAISQNDIGLTHLCFQVSNADEAYERITKAGSRALSKPLELRSGASKTFYSEGPEGIIVEFLELRT